MSVCLLLISIAYLILCCECSLLTDECFEMGNKKHAQNKEIALWMMYPMESNSIEDKKKMDSIISLAVHSISISSAWIFPNFLTQYGLQHFKQAFNDMSVWRQQLDPHTIFQDVGDYHSGIYSENHTRNELSSICSAYFQLVPDLNLDPFGSLYEYEPLLLLLNEVTTRSKWKTPIFRSPDSESKYYAVTYDPSTAEQMELNVSHAYQWHYDAHPFTCIIMIQNDPLSGVFEYVPLRPPFSILNHSSIIPSNMYGYETGVESQAYDNENDFWKLIRLILRNDEQIQPMKHEINAAEGSMYCFFGNETFHRATPSNPNAVLSRDIFTMMYFTDNHFELPKTYAAFDE